MSSAALAHELPVVDPESFNKYEWHERFHRAIDAGECSSSTSYIATSCLRSCGTAEPNCHLPLVWKQDKALIELSGVSGPTYRKRRNHIIDAGFMFEISDALPGRQKIKVLKMPEWDEIKALRIALQALQIWQENRKSNVRRIIRAVKRALRNLEAAASCVGADKAPARATPQPSAQKTVTKALFVRNEKDFRSPLYNNKSTTSDSVVGRSIEEPTRIEPQEPPPTIAKKGVKTAKSSARPAPAHRKKSFKNEKQTARVLDYQQVRALKITLIELFAGFGRVLDEGVAVRLAKAYGQQDATPDTLVETIEIKLLRLFADGYKVGHVVKFLLDDAPDWAPPPPDVLYTIDQRIPVSAHKPPDLDPFTERIYELQQDGLGFSEATEQAKTEFGGWPEWV